jgi:hypothetical protein
MEKGSIIVELDDYVLAQCVSEWVQRMANIRSELVRRDGKNGQNGQNGECEPPQQWKFPHKFACAHNDTWLSRSSFLSTWSSLPLA